MMQVYIHKNVWTWGQTHTIVYLGGVGLVNISIEDDNRDVATIHGLSVLPEARGKGNGTKLLKLAEKEALEMGASRICLATEPDSWIESWYKRLGYEFDSYNEDNLILLIKILK